MVKISYISLKQAYEHYNSPEFIFIDLRSSEEYEKDHIYGAFSIPMKDLKERVTELKNEQNIIFYADALSYSDIEKITSDLSAKLYYLKGGFEEWKSNSFQSEGKKRKVEVSVFVTEPKLEFLALHTAPDRGSFWQDVFGKIETGESLLDGAKRELLEETGISKDNIKALFEIPKKYFEGQDKRKIKERILYHCDAVFCCCLKSKAGVDISKNPDKEHDDFKWVSPKEAFSIFGWQTTKDIINALLLMRLENKL